MRTRLLITLLVAFVLNLGSWLMADSEAPGKQPEKAAARTPKIPLSVEQDAVKNRYARFERMMEQMERYLRKTDPARAELLRRAINQSKEERIAWRMAEIIKMLDSSTPLYGDVLNEENAVLESLKSIMTLLQTEDPFPDILDKIKQYEGYIEDIKEIEGDQKRARNATERGGNPDKLSSQEKKVAGKTQDLTNKIDREDAADSNQNNSGQQSEQDQQKTPGREELEQALEEMKRAIEELKQKKLDDASDHQDEALAKLQEAREKIKELLRQLREEERELLLAALEARFQKMLALQLVVYNRTVKIGELSQEQLDKWGDAQFKDLAFKERDIVIEANKALTLLKEEGSSIAFPEAVEQLVMDMKTVANRLENRQGKEFTQALELDIIDALQEMIEALQKEMEKSDEEEQDGQQQQSQQQDNPLVETLAELKMLRTLQLRINKLTKRLGMLVSGEQATKADIVQQLQILAKRQAKIREATRDLATGRNK